jgi:SAM-dependent methyltransferase
MATVPKTQYNTFAPKYASLEGEVPFSKLEAQLVDLALGDCSGLTILDLGGGNGGPARRAVEAGAAVVDVVDISAEMLRVGRETEARLGRQGRIRWFEADVTRPLATQQVTAADGGDGLRADGYDVVMANWLFDHATSLADLEGMWANIVSYLRPGGRFLGIRSLNVYAEHMSASSAKYGFCLTHIEKIPGGVKYMVDCRVQPPFSFEATSMESTYLRIDDIPRRLGLVDFAVIDPKDTEAVKEDPEFWDDFVKDPSCGVVVARKP